MKIAVLGAGIQGTACVYDLLNNPQVSEVAVADGDLSRAENLIRKLRALKETGAPMKPMQV